MKKTYKLVYIENTFMLFDDFYEGKFDYYFRWFPNFILLQGLGEFVIEQYHPYEIFPFQVEHFENQTHHNTSGPAIMKYDSFGNLIDSTFFLNGSPYTEEGWFKSLIKAEKTKALFNIPNWRSDEKRTR